MRGSSSRLKALANVEAEVKDELPPANKRARRSSRRGAEGVTGGGGGNSRDTASQAESAEAEAPKVEKEEEEEEEEDHATTSTGPSAYELERLEKIRRNAEVMAKLGLGTAAGEMRTTVASDAAKRAKARGLTSRKPPQKRERTRASGRLRGINPDGVPMEDPEAAFIKNGRKIYNNGYSIHTVDTTSNYASGHVSEPPPRPSYRSSRFSGDLSFVDAASGASGDGSLQLKQMLGGMVGRYGVDEDDTDVELTKPDEALTRLRSLSVAESGVCKVVTERGFSISWHPSNSKLLVAVGDKCGNVGVWDIDKGSDGVLEFKPHVGAVPRLEFDPLDGHKLLSTSYDGSVRRMDVEKGNFEQVHANKESDDVIITYSHLLAEERLLLLSDGDGDITAVDLRTNQEVWKREAHEKKANTVHAHPIDRHIFATASLDRSVKLWDARNLGAGKGANNVKGMVPLADMPHFRSVNSAHFSPTGEWLATVGQDDKIKLYKDLAQTTGGKAAVAPVYSLAHNNQTGRWLTKFQASWDPKSEGLFAVGSMQKAPHGVHLYSVPSEKGGKRPSAVSLVGGDIMTSIQSLAVFHPKRDVVAGVNASGRVHVFM